MSMTTLVLTVRARSRVHVGLLTEVADMVSKPCVDIAPTDQAQLPLPLVSVNWRLEQLDQLDIEAA